MSLTNSEATGDDGTHGSGATDQSGPRRALSTAVRFGRSGAAAALAGGLLLVAAVRTARRTRRAGMLALTGCALLGIGLRQRRAGDSSAARDGSIGRDGARTSGEETSAEAAAHEEQSEVLHQSETNPRGVSGEPDVETETGADEGDVQFTTEQDEGAKAKPNLDETEEDPRRPDEEDPVTSEDHVEVNLSESAMADEASEATGPDPEQSYPASEGTDPEPMSEKAPERREEGAVANADSDDEGGRTDDDPGEATDADGEETTDDKTMDDEETP